MSGESQQREALRSTPYRRTGVQKCTPQVPVCRFGTVVLALWPIKPALNLAQRAGCSERAANFYITGKRDPSVAALLAIIHEIRGRRRA
jgi:hypothetical protein